MKKTPLPIQALRAGAIVLAVGAGSWLVISSQHNANPEPSTEAPKPQANPAENDVSDQGDPPSAPGALDPTFIYGSKSFVPEASALGVSATEQAEVEAVDPTFMFSSKSIALPTQRPADLSILTTVNEAPEQEAPSVGRPAPAEFFHSSKNSVTIELPEIANPFGKKEAKADSAAKDAGKKKAKGSSPKQ